MKGGGCKMWGGGGGGVEGGTIVHKARRARSRHSRVARRAAGERVGRSTPLLHKVGGLTPGRVTEMLTKI